MKRVCILVLGTRGDVAPLLALGARLQEEGCSVKVAAPDNFKAWVEGLGFEFQGLGIDMEQFLQSREVREVAGGNWLGLFRIWRAQILGMMKRMLDNLADCAIGADTIIYHPKVYAATDLAEATGARLICAAPIPIFPTREFPPVVWARRFTPWLNRWLYSLFSLSRLPYLSLINRWRAERLGLGPGPGLAPIGATGAGLCPRLCGVSPSVIPRPHDWDDGAHMTGYWFFDGQQEWQPAPQLKSFLERGEPPIYLGFGSMTTRDPQGTTREVLRALELVGIRAVIATGWGALEQVEVPTEVHLLKSAPHHRLFPLCRAVVHHGGAGTTASGLRAGRPTLVCPQMVDQPFWGRRVQQLGCGPAPLKLRTLRADELAQRLEELVERESYQERAAELQQRIVAEGGVGKAVEVILGSKTER